MMRATEFEFRQRFFCIGVIFGIGFFCYSFDRVNAGLAVARWFWGGKVNVVTGSAPSVATHTVFGFAAALTILAATLRTWAAAYLRSEIVHDTALHSEGLVADGPFRFVRNPLYVGGVLLGAGMGLLASRVGWFVITFGLLIFYYRLIGREEAALDKEQGNSFRAYRAAVPRFLPSLVPRVKSSGMRPRWAQAFGGELFLWAFASGTLAFAVTLNFVILWIVVGAGFLAYMVYLFSSRTRRRRAVSTPPDSE